MVKSTIIILLVSIFAVNNFTNQSVELTADFEFIILEDEPTKVVFNNLSTEADKYLWDFENRNSSQLKSPTHDFKDMGIYEVTLTCIKDDDTISTTKEIPILKSKGKSLVAIDTDFGTMTFRLYDATPKHRDNFIKLAKTGYLDNTLFHRVMQGFIIQGGDPDSQKRKDILGQGGPGYDIPAEFVENINHFKGALAAARRPNHTNPEQKSNGSQFYIVQGSPHTKGQLQQYVNQKSQRSINVRYTYPQVRLYEKLGGTPVLDMEYTIFGQMESGFEVLDSIAAVSVGNANRPTEDVPMKVRLIKK